MQEEYNIKLDRTRIDIKPNSYVKYKNLEYKITQLLNFNEVIGIDVVTKKAKLLPIAELSSIEPSKNIDAESISKDISEINDSEYKEAKRRYEAILPLLEKNLSRKDSVEYSKKIGIHFTTLYRWQERYKSTGTILGLISNKVGAKKGNTRLNSEIEILIKRIIDSYYLTIQKPSVQSVVDKVLAECKRMNIVAPHSNTIRNRIEAITEYEKLKKQGSKGIARTKYEPAPNKFEADYPLQLIEIDHTECDIILVDDEHRLPIGRPWITVAIDIYSRMIVGYYLSMNAPSVTSVGMCVSNTILPKDTLLAKFDVNANWNVWGFPETIHVDNGADFRADAVKKAGLAHGINIEFRPVGRANFGGHIERAIGTLMSEIHNLPGTTFSNIKQRGEYNSDANASMTFFEFEKWLVTFITKIYHKRVHNSLFLTPEQQWEEGLFGDENSIGFIQKPSSNSTIILDFLPIYERTIQKNGVNIEGLNYYDHVLRTKINQTENGKKKQFIFKRDPRDISYVWFYEESTKEYFKIPVANQNMPSMTAWEFYSIKTNLKNKGLKRVNQDAILEAREELHNQIQLSVKNSKKARRDSQRLKNKDIEMKEINNNFSNNKINIDNQNHSISESFWDEEIPEF
ncbi:Mu transposase C-terminal domain-containing protein [Aliarcobacter butzleri]|uniref:Mu transposase C-terminal domain-containing protein n=1 Tax=Aliarcobacter butzleri TaxID=28197 RepID=UPI001EDA1FF9|nr:Mu transposase C-terminal domain-containing protein [Aliarcobacter butzleri]MCG3674098.1 DDE-type integrase/transposase/recombinase [Aliarcobacter butzleri]MCG3712644.1 DDE-type integrase/transposase/recombinase [Aliarcobacter butzleri]